MPIHVVWTGVICHIRPLLGPDTSDSPEIHVQSLLEMIARDDFLF
jgi:hypothetical protein